jgi:crotonobetainyl-CoA:carnitine CoA-transferase CaiB-like acyl-CoA transferase
MRGAGATVGPIYSIADAAEDPHFSGREIIVDAEDREFGSLPMHNIVPRLSQTPGVWRRPAPALGEHTAEVLTEAGLDAAEIASLQKVEVS